MSYPYEEILSQFEPMTLSEMDSVALLDRTDTKYVVNTAMLDTILKGLQSSYKILDINGLRYFNYESYYFDTPDLSLFTKHHNGISNRLKMRYRRYVQSDLNFFEIKFKNNKSRTIKKRVMTDTAGVNLCDKAKELIATRTNMNATDLQIAATINYARITLISKNMDERATIDLNLEVIRNGVTKHFPSLAIVEVKQAKFDYSSPINRLLKSMHIIPASLSKYCWAMTQCDSTLKANNFKSQQLYVSKILNQKHSN